jgi:hypothetical protein
VMGRPLPVAVPLALAESDLIVVVGRFVDP